MLLMIARVEAVKAEEGVLPIHTEPLMMNGAARADFVTRPCVWVLKNAARATEDPGPSPVIHPLINCHARFCTALQARKAFVKLTWALNPANQPFPS